MEKYKLKSGGNIFVVRVEHNVSLRVFAVALTDNFYNNNEDFPEKLTKKELINYDLKGLELADIDTGDMKKFNIKQGVKIENITNDELSGYAAQLKGGIILSIDNMKATDIETITKILSKKAENQRSQIELITVNGQILRFLL